MEYESFSVQYKFRVRDVRLRYSDSLEKDVSVADLSPAFFVFQRLNSFQIANARGEKLPAEFVMDIIQISVLVLVAVDGDFWWLLANLSFFLCRV